MEGFGPSPATQIIAEAETWYPGTSSRVLGRSTISTRPAIRRASNKSADDQQAIVEVKLPEDARERRPSAQVLAKTTARRG